MAERAMVWFKFGIDVKNSNNQANVIKEAIDTVLDNPEAYVDADTVDEIEIITD